MNKWCGKYFIVITLALSFAATLMVYVKAEAQWEAEWQKTLEAGKKEGKVVVYTTAPGQMRKALQSGFKEKFQIEVEVSSFRGGEMGAKLLTERKAGLYLVDVFVGGSTTPITQLKPTGALDPLDKLLVLPEVTDTKSWYQEKLWWIDEARTLLMFLGFPVPNLAVNTSMVKLEEIKSYKDLLDPRWKGKIVMNDPTVPGTAAKGFSVIGWHLLNLDYWRELAKQEPVISRNQRLQMEWVARGKYPILFFPQSAVATEFIRAGAPIASYTPAEGTYVTGASGNVAIMNRAPHPNATKIFINWMLSREGQIAFSQAFGRQSLRVDVGTEGLDPVALRRPDGKYFTGTENEEFLSKQTEQMVIAREIFAPLLK
ncbi:MAG: extracellular solute-binding protein [Desulfobacterales bacterium]|nr:extracellular solute-binding protein [Desulfobacterales bacterium]